MIRLELLAAHTHLHATLCAACPMGPAGCCATPPGVEWSDAGRIVALGGLSALLGEIAAGRLRPGPRGLLMQRVDPEDGSGPRRCVYHGPRGCTIPPDRRAATCNYYVCDDVLGSAGEGERARRVLDALVALYGAWDREIGALVAERWPGGAPWDGPFLAFLGEQFTRLSRSTPGELSP